jgi:hypothetical protein
LNDKEMKRVLTGADEIVEVLGHRRLSTGLTIAETLSGLRSIIASLASRHFRATRRTDPWAPPENTG